MLRTRWVAGAVALLLQGVALSAQDTPAEDEARSRALSQRMRQALQQQARVLSQMQREMERAARAQVPMRDSMVRAAARRIAEISAELARIQAEGNRAQKTVLDAEAREQLQEQLVSAREMANLARTLAGQQRALTYRFSARPAEPRGYLGVTLSSVQSTDLRDGRVLTVFESPSVIESVEAGGPAALAGLEAGDTIVAFGRLSLPGSVPLSEVMTPGERLPIRIRRKGHEKVIPVLVGTRPAAFPGFSLSITGGEADGEGGRYSRTCSDGECTVTVSPAAPPSPMPPRAASARAASPRPPAPPAPISSMMSWSPNDMSIAGATLTTVTAELEDLTGVDEGILVLRVAPGTPAAQSGLRGGDVIVGIDDEDADGVLALRLAVQRATSRGTRKVELVVSRQRRERELTLKW